MADNRKPIETRHWPAPAWLIGQEFAIHAAMRIDANACIYFGYDPLTIPRGCILSIHKLTKCEKFTERSRDEIGDEYGDFEMGRYGWFAPLLRKLNPPIAAKGHQGIWKWPAPKPEGKE
jgi:hypothetical protein